MWALQIGALLPSMESEPYEERKGWSASSDTNTNGKQNTWLQSFWVIVCIMSGALQVEDLVAGQHISTNQYVSKVK
eukprot:6714125-Ditylum_brightwellii.AAC.1